MKNVLIIGLMVAVTLTAFAGGQGEASSDGEQTLTVWNFKYSEETAGAAFREMDQLYMEKNPNVVIEHIAQPHDNYYELIAAAVASGQGPDVILTHADQRIWNLSEGIASLDPYIGEWKDEVSDLTWRACSATGDPDESIKIVPLTSQGVGIYYNKNAFEEAGLDRDDAPTSWDEFLAAAEALRDADITPIMMGNQGSPFGIDFFYRTQLANFFGPEISGFADGSVNFDDPGFIEATRMLKELYDRELVNVENGSIPYFMDAVEQFKQGNGGFFVGLTSDVAHWKDFGEALGYENLGYFPSINHPEAEYRNRQVNQGAGIGLAIMESSDEKELAADYIYEYVHGESGSVWVDTVGAILPTSSSSSDNEMLSNIVSLMNQNAVPDFYTLLEPGFASDLYNYMQLFFLAEDISLEEYISRLQSAYEESL